jgi:putative spermidine/putrescine transport system ATP-binding protein
MDLTNAQKEHHPSYLIFDQVKKTYDQKTLVVKDFSLQVNKGEFVTLLGPSGSGKSTVLMMLAGFESVTSGNISIGGVSITKTAPYNRNIGMVFQNYALFPHMTIAENLAYPLTLRKKSKTQVRTKVQEYLKLIEMGEFGGRYPGQLSGGQRQRVALARALIFEPALVLMDEPLGALDKKLREQMQYEITRLHQAIGFTVIYVTHDQTEALSMSDRIAVFNAGVVQQCATPAELYEKPANAFVADFIGENNFIRGRTVSVDGDVAIIDVPGGEQVKAQAADGVAAGKSAKLSVRPEKLFIDAPSIGSRNCLKASYVTRHYVGDFIRYYFRLSDGSEVNVKVLNDMVAPEFTMGDMAVLSWRENDCFAYPATDT